MANLVHTFVPHKGHCLAIVFDDCAFRVTNYMPRREAAGLLPLATLDDMMQYIPVYRDCLATNGDPDSCKRVLARLRHSNIPQTARV